jgi:hypothetical protein
MGHATMENRHGLPVAGMVTLADDTAERRASETMLKAKAKETGHRITVGEDKAFDSADHVAGFAAKHHALAFTPNTSCQVFIVPSEFQHGATSAGPRPLHRA